MDDGWTSSSPYRLLCLDNIPSTTLQTHSIYRKSRLSTHSYLQELLSAEVHFHDFELFQWQFLWFCYLPSHTHSSLVSQAVGRDSRVPGIRRRSLTYNLETVLLSIHLHLPRHITHHPLAVDIKNVCIAKNPVNLSAIIFSFIIL